MEDMACGQTIGGKDRRFTVRVPLLGLQMTKAVVDGLSRRVKDSEPHTVIPDLIPSHRFRRRSVDVSK
jgi:hypothetical protein